MIQRRDLLAGCAIVTAVFCAPLAWARALVRRPADPVDRQATAETRALLANMHRLAGRGVMFGHQNTLLYGYTWRDEPDRSDVNDVVGDFPAIYGWDIMDVLGNGRPGEAPSAGPERLRALVRQVRARGGINTFSWHKPNPVTGTDAWDKTPAVAAIIPGGALHDAYKAELDRVAEFFLSLTDEDGRPIPVWFRPWHEHSGDWFWWGKPNASCEDFIALWRFTVDYLTRVKAVHTLLWAFSTDVFDSEAQFFDYYPGDAWVDLLGFDDYHSIETDAGHDLFVWRLSSIARWAAARGKLAALTESGLQALPDASWWTRILLKGLLANAATRRISYALVWRNANPRYDRKEHFYAPYRGQKSAPDFIRFHDDPATLFERDLPPMYVPPGER